MNSQTIDRNKLYNRVPNNYRLEKNGTKCKAISEEDGSKIVGFELDGNPASYNEGSYFEFQIMLDNRVNNLSIAAGKDNLYVKGTNQVGNEQSLYIVLCELLRRNIDLARYNLPNECILYKDVGGKIEIMTNSAYTNKFYGKEER